MTYKLPKLEIKIKEIGKKKFLWNHNNKFNKKLFVSAQNQSAFSCIVNVFQKVFSVTHNAHVISVEIIVTFKIVDKKLE